MNRPHLDEDDAIAAASDDGAGAAFDAHLTLCAACRERVRDARTIRAFALAAERDEIAPPRHFANRALAMIRARHAVVASVNETVDAVGTIGRSFAHFVFGRRP